MKEEYKIAVICNNKEQFDHVCRKIYSKGPIYYNTLYGNERKGISIDGWAKESWFRSIKCYKVLEYSEWVKSNKNQLIINNYEIY